MQEQPIKVALVRLSITENKEIKTNMKDSIKFLGEF